MPQPRCGGYTINGTVVQWARTREQFERHYYELRAFGVRPHMAVARGLTGRWAVVVNLIEETDSISLLDVGGFGTYNDHVPRHACINIHPHDGCEVYAGRALPYGRAEFDMVVVETVLHHAAEDALHVFNESARVARRHVLVAEDVLDRRASIDVVETYHRHDPRAIYRSSEEWVALGVMLGLRLAKLIYLHRVPIHVAREAKECVLGFAPMLYFLFSKEPIKTTRKSAVQTSPSFRCHRRSRRREALLTLVDVCWVHRTTCRPRRAS